MFDSMCRRRRVAVWMAIQHLDRASDTSSAVYDLAWRLLLYTWERQAILESPDCLGQFRGPSGWCAESWHSSSLAEEGEQSTIQAVCSRATSALFLIRNTNRRTIGDQFDRMIVDPGKDRFHHSLDRRPG